MTTWTIHGFNVRDLGEGSTDRLLPYLTDSRDYDYGYVGLLKLRCVNRDTVEALARQVQPGDAVVAHSNGCLIAWQLAQRVRLGAVVCINPALRRDTLWPDDLPVLCIANRKDWVVQLGRMWGRLASFGGLYPHGWGAAGRYGFTSGQPLVKNWFSDDPFWKSPVRGHSAPLQKPEYWGPLIDAWIQATL